MIAYKNDKTDNKPFNVIRASLISAITINLVSFRKSNSLLTKFEKWIFLSSARPKIILDFGFSTDVVKIIKITLE